MHVAKRRWLMLMLFPVLVVALVSCDSAPQPAPPPGPVETWIRQHAISLQTVEPGGSDADLQALKPVVGNATLVGLGEATHGAHEFFALKTRLIEYLVNDLGFTTLAMENGWDASRPMDTYITTGQGDARALLRSDFYGAWRTQEILDMLNWMRAYNADPAHTAKVHFVGIDSWNVTQAIFDDVGRYIQTVDPAQAAQARAWYAGFRPTRAAPVFVDYDGFSALPPATKQRYQNNAQQVYDVLQSHQAAYVRRSSAGAFALALHEARIIVQYTTLGVLIPTGGTLFSSEAAYDRRDAFMAENVEWLYDQQRGAPGGGKIVIWAHNVHIASLHQPQNMGAILRARYQNSYLRIGTSFFQGSFTILGASGPSVMTAPAPAASSYNSALGSIGPPLFALDIRATPPGAVTDWLDGPRALINFGVGGQDLEMDGSLRYWFDVVVHVQRITPSHLLG